MITKEKQEEFTLEVAKVINRLNLEYDSNTPDFILARHLLWCLLDFNATIQAKEDRKARP